MANACRRHGDGSNSRRKYTEVMASKGIEPWGTCNDCWAFYESAQATRKKPATTQPVTAAVPATPVQGQGRR